MQDLASAATSIAAFMTSSCDPAHRRFPHPSNTTAIGEAATWLSVVVLAGTCGVCLGWQGRGWRARHRYVSYMRREYRQRSPLWLLPAPSVRRTTLLPEWVAASVGQRWLPGLVWSPPLLRYCAVAYAADSDEGRSAKAAQQDAVQWGTRVLNRLHGLPVRSMPESSGRGRLALAAPRTSAATLSPTLESCASSTSFLSAIWSSEMPQWACLPSYAVDVFTCTEASCASTAASSLSQLCMPLRVLPRQAFALLYDPVARLSLWCGYHLTQHGVNRACRQRRCVAVYTDRTLEKSSRRVPMELQQRGFDRGHLAPHASVATTAQAALEASLLTNLHLQHREINRGVWRWLEAATRAYVRVPYHDSEACVDPGTGGTKGQAVRRGGLLLARLLAKATPFAAVTDAQRVRRRRGGWWPRGRAGTAEEEGRHLCVNVGPLYYAAVTSSTGPAACTTRRPSFVQGVAGDSKMLRLRRQRHRQRGRSHKRSSHTMHSAPCDAVNTRLIPDAFFLSLWDAQTHHHVNLVVPNTPAAPEVLTLTQALAAASTRPTRAPSRSHRHSRHYRGKGRAGEGGLMQETRVPSSTSAAAASSFSTTMHATAAKSADAAVVEALSALAVSTEHLERLFAESVVELRVRGVACQQEVMAQLNPACVASEILPTAASSQGTCHETRRCPPPLRPSLTLRKPFRFYPVYRERWVWQTRWQRLAHHMLLPELLWWRRRKGRAVTLCQ